LVSRINSLWAENVGAELTWLTADQVAREVRAYIDRGIDFLKYASSEHRSAEPSAFLAFSPAVQAGIVNEAHRAGLTAQAHTFAVEALRVSIEAGVDIIQHCNMTGPTPIPASTLQLLVDKGVASTVFPFTQRRFEKISATGSALNLRLFSCGDLNVRNLIEANAKLLLATDAGCLAAEAATDPVLGKAWIAAGEDNLAELGQGHFHWMKAMEEKGYPAMAILKAATSNIAAAYAKDADLGTLQPGRIADMILLDRNPLESADNYRSIHMIFKDGLIVERSRLPVAKRLTNATEQGAGCCPSLQ
jgi:imidazolonepropionase-like amidohydrolase